MSLPKVKKKKDGTLVIEDSVTPAITQAQLDSEAIFASAARINPEQAANIKANAADNNIMSAGVLTSLARLGGNTGKGVTSTIASIDAQTRSKRLADQQDIAAKRATEAFNNSGWGQFWSGVKGISRGITVAATAPWELLTAGARTFVPAGIQAAKAYVAGVAGVPTPAETNNVDAVSQTVAGQIIKSAISQKTLFPKVDLGQGFFPSEDTGAGLKAREAALNSAKIEIKNSTGKVIGYRPLNLFADNIANITTLGHPDSVAGTVISAVSDLAGSFMVDPQLAHASELKRLAKAKQVAEVKGTMNEVAKIEEQTKKVKEAQAVVKQTQKDFMAQDASMKYDSVAKAQQDYEIAKSVRIGKNTEAINADQGVRRATARLDEFNAIKATRDADLVAAKAAYDEAFNAAKAPSRIATTERKLADAKAALANEKELDATIGNRISKAPELEKTVATLQENLINLNKIAEAGRVVPKEEIAGLADKLNAAKAAVTEINDNVKAIEKVVKDRQRTARITAGAREKAALAYLKSNKTVKSAEQVLNDQAIIKDDKVKIFSDSLEKLAGLKDSAGNINVDYSQIARFLTGGYGEAAVNRLVEITDWRKIWRASGKRIDSTAAKNIANATTKEQVIDALAPFISRGEVKYGLMKPGIIERAGMNLEERTGKLLPAIRSLTGTGAAVASRMAEHEKIGYIFQKALDGSSSLAKTGKRLYQTKLSGGQLLNIHDTEALLTAVDNFGQAVKLDSKVLDNLLEKISTGPSAANRGFDASVELMKLVEAQYGSKIPKHAKAKWDDAIRIFKESTERMSSYWATQHINGAKIEYLTIGGEKIVLNGPHLDSELLNSTIYLPPATEFIKLLSKVEKFALSAQTRDVADYLINDFWKKMQLVRPAFIIRNIAEEQLRMFGTGHISFFNHPGAALAMWLGAKEGPGWRKFLHSMDNYTHTIFGDEFTSGNIAEDLANEVNAHRMKDSYVAMMSLDTAGSFDERAYKLLSFKNVGAVGPGHVRFFDGLANQMRILNSSEFARVVAGFTPTEVAKAMSEGMTRADAVVEYFFSGPGRRTLEEFTGSQSQDIRNFMHTREGLKKYLFTAKDGNGFDVSVQARIAEITGGNRSLMQLIAKGSTKTAGKEFKIPRPDAEAGNSLRNAKSVRETKKALLTAQEEFAKEIKDTFSKAGNWDNVLVNVPSRNMTLASKTDKVMFVDKFFDLATKLEKNSTFGPEFRQVYWDAINQIAGALDAEAKAKLLVIAEKSLSPLQKTGMKGSKILYPELQVYKDGGSGGLLGTRSVVGFVKTSALKDMHGNTPGNREAIDAYRQSLREGKGFATHDYQGKPYNDPIMVVYDNETGLAYVGEGNHRLQAAIEEGISYVPVRVVRGNKEEMVTDAKSGRFPQQIKNNKEPKFVETAGSNAGNPVGQGYIPPEMHPSYVFDKSAMAQNVEEGLTYGKNHPVWEAFRNADGKGPMSIEDAHRYADNMARNHIKDLFYNAQERRLLFHQLRLIGPFMNAWEDTIRKWSEIGIENPVQVYKLGKSLNWLTNPESSALYQMTDARDTYDPNQGFFFNDPQSGQRVFWVPFAGTVMGKLASVVTGNAYKGTPISFTTNPMSFNFALGAGSILPGIGPGITLPLSVIGTFNQSFVDNLPEGIKNWLFPFGRSDFSSGLQSAILPANWNRIAGGLMGIEATYASSFKPVMSYIASGGNYNIDDPNDQAELIHKTDQFARWFSVMQGVVGLFSPSALTKKGITTDEKGDATTQIALYDDFKKILVSNDGDYNKSVYDMLNIYGVNGMFAIISSSAGNGPSNWDSYKFVTKHPDVATKYSDIWGFVYPGGGLSSEMYRWNLVNGAKTKLSAKDLLNKANSIRYFAAKDALLKKVEAGQLDKAQYAEASSALKDAFGGGPKGKSDPNKTTREISQLRMLIADSRFIDIPAVQGLRDYMYLRDIALKNLNKRDDQQLTGTNDAAVANRAWLAEQAVWILNNNPDFYKMYYEFFANELENK